MLYFSWVRERIGHAEEHISLPASVHDVSDVIDFLATRGGGYAAAFGEREKLRAAIDQEFVPLDAPIAGAREIAIFPPVTGG
jgi:molybdopterin synthase sulfur carrier subunit